MSTEPYMSDDLHKWFFRDPKAKGQWWHYVAALKTKSGREYGVQFTGFDILGKQFTHCAVTDVREREHIRYDFNPESFTGRTIGNYQDATGFYYYLEFEGVILRFYYGEKREYPSPTSIHVGMPRMAVSGTIRGESVKGVGCFDREIFDRLLLPGERGWEWWVHWLDNGKTDMGYDVFSPDSDRHIRQRLVPSKRYQMIPITGYQWWKETDHSVGYVEEMVIVADENYQRIGVGYRELVGLSGTPDF